MPLVLPSIFWEMGLVLLGVVESFAPIRGAEAFFT